jgi:peptidoglycan-associated lipoprotein
MRRMGFGRFVAVGVIALLVAAACGKKPAPVTRPMPPPVTDTGATPAAPPPPPTPVEEPVLPAPTPGDAIGSKDLDALNRESPLAPVYFGLDSFEISAEGRTILQNTAQILQKQPTWQITVEGHCDERGTAEYNLSLGERRAVAAKTYLVSLGVSADRLRTVSYGKEFPFDPGHDESAYAKNRRAHFVITAK